jgi:selenocysteine lyase/cysteine desulfurase
MLPNQRDLFDIPADVAYFNCASLAPLMRPALEAGEKAFSSRAHPWTITSDDWFDLVERRRTLFASVIGAPSENIALITATSYGLAIAANNLAAREGQRVLLIAEDYPSAVYTWRRFCERTGASLHTIERQGEQDWTSAILAALDEKVAIVQVPNVHWTDGALIDLAAVAARAHAVGARLVVDASQSLGAMPFDFDAIRPDFLVGVGYKWLLGPFGLGYLYVAEQWLNGAPLEENWINRRGSNDFARLVDYQDQYQQGARRFDMGQRTAFELTPASIATLENLDRWTVAAIAERLADVTGRIERAVSGSGIRLTSVLRGPHMLGLALPAQLIQPAVAKLKSANVFVGVRGSSIRVSPHVYTTDEDIDRLTSALSEAVG